MNTKTTLTVLLIAVALGIYVAVFETERFGLRGETTRQRERELALQPLETGERLFEADALEAATVRTLTITRGERPEAVFRKREDDSAAWDQVQPVRFPVETNAVTDLVELTRSLRYTLTIEVDQAGNALDQLGLDRPRGVVEIETDDGETLELFLGRRTAAGRAYATLGEPSLGSTVYIVGDALHEAVLDESLLRLRRKELANFTFGNAREVRLQRRDEPTLELVQRGGRWRLKAPAAGRADTNAARQLVAALTAGRVDQFVEDRPESLQPFGLDEPRTVLDVEVVETVDAGDEQDLVDRTRQYKLAIGSPRNLQETSYFAMLNDEPVVFSLTRATVDRLSVAVEDLRDRSLSPVARTDVRQITVDRGEAGGVALDLVRSGSSDWSFGEDGPGFRLDPQEMDRLLDALFESRAVAFEDASEIDEPLLATVTLAIEQRSEDERLRLYGSAGDEQVRVVRNDEPAAAVVDRDDVQLLLAESLALRYRTLLELRDEQVEAVSVERTGPHAAKYEITRQDPEGDGDAPGAWDYSGYERERVRRAFRELVPLRAERWVGDAEEPGDERMTVTLALTDGGRRELTIDPQTRVATLDDEPQAFRVPASLVRALAAELRDTRVLELEIEDIAAVEVGELTVHRDREGLFSLSGPTDGRLDEAAVARLWDALAGLRAERFVPHREIEGDADRTLTITTHDGVVHRLELFLDDDEPVGRLDDQVITLTPDVVRVLTASLTRE